jgi:hypothetical protein
LLGCETQFTLDLNHQFIQSLSKAGVNESIRMFRRDVPRT